MIKLEAINISEPKRPMKLVHFHSLTDGQYVAERIKRQTSRLKVLAWSRYYPW